MKPPAFQFYADDFLAGTFTFTNEQRGLYIALLCLQWNQGFVTEETIASLAGQMASGSVAVVRAKFQPDEQDGTLRNQRLELERQKQAQFRAKCAEAGRRSVEGRLKVPSRNLEGGGQPKGNSPSPSPSPISNKTKTVASSAKPPKPLPEKTDGEWLEELKANPAYEGIDVGREYAKMGQWCQVNRKEPTRRRFINWLNRCEKPLKAAPAAPQATGATTFLLSRELQDVDKAIAELDRQSYEPSGLSQAEREHRKRLKEQRAALRQKLGLT